MFTPAVKMPSPRRKKRRTLEEGLSTTLTGPLEFVQKFRREALEFDPTLDPALQFLQSALLAPGLWKVALSASSKKSWPLCHNEMSKTPWDTLMSKYYYCKTLSRRAR